MTVHALSCSFYRRGHCNQGIREVQEATLSHTAAQSRDSTPGLMALNLSLSLEAAAASQETFLECLKSSPRGLAGSVGAVTEHPEHRPCGCGFPGSLATTPGLAGSDAGRSAGLLLPADVSSESCSVNAPSPSREARVLTAGYCSSSTTRGPQRPRRHRRSSGTGRARDGARLELKEALGVAKTQGTGTPAIQQMRDNLQRPPSSWLPFISTQCPPGAVACG